MLPKVIQDKILKQINMEFFSAYLYLGLAAKCEQLHFRGAAQWMRAQAREETGHGMRLFEFLIDRDIPVQLFPIEAPAADPKSLLDVFELSLDHEKKVTASLEDIYATLVEEKAFSALAELTWFLTEQVEEEKTVRNIVKTLQLIKDDMSSLVEFDKELGKRSQETASPEPGE